MLLDFKMENFRSFCDACDFSLLSSRQREHAEILLKNKKKRRVNPSAIVYGANGSGKTNLFRGMTLLKNIVMAGGIAQSRLNNEYYRTKSIPEVLELTPFLYQTDDRPVAFEIEFEIEKKIFCYGLSYKIDKTGDDWKGILNEEHLLVNEERLFKRNFHTVDINWNSKELQHEMNDAQVSFFGKQFERNINDEELFLTGAFETTVSKEVASLVEEF